MPRRTRIRRRRTSLQAILIVAALVIGIAATIFLSGYFFALVSPPIKWLKPHKVYIGSIELHPLAWAQNPSGAVKFAFCKKDINQYVYFREAKPPGWLSDQWQYVSSPDGKEWAWFFDYQDNTDCAPNLGIYAKVLNVREDPRIGIATVDYSIIILVSADPWLGGFYVSMESYTYFKNSYVMLKLIPPYPVLDAEVDGKKAEYYYEQDGSVAFILFIQEDIPGTFPVSESVKQSLKKLGPIGFFWVDGFGVQHGYTLRVTVKTSALVTNPTDTVAATLRLGSPVATAIWYGTPSYATIFRTVTTTITVTSFPRISEYTTVIRGQTVTEYRTVGTTVYDVRTFTVTGIRTVVTTFTYTEPTTVTVTMYKEKTITKKETETMIVPEEVEKLLEVIPWWAWLLVIILFMIIAAMVAGAAARGAAARGAYYGPYYGPPPRRRGRGRGRARIMGEYPGVMLDAAPA